MTPEANSPGAALASMMRLHMLRMRRSKRVWWAAVLMLAATLYVIITRYVSPVAIPTQSVAESIKNLFFAFAVFALPFFFQSSVLSNEIQTRTLPYLTSRPVGRIPMLLGKYLCNAALVAVLLTAGMLLLHVGSYATLPTALFEEVPFLLRSTLALVALSFVYGAVCICLATIAPKANIMLTILYFLVIEIGFGRSPGMFGFASLNKYARTLAGVHDATTPIASHSVSATVLLAALVFFLTVAAVVVQNTEFRNSSN